MIADLPRLSWLVTQALVAQAEAERLTLKLAELGFVTSPSSRSRLPNLLELEESRERCEARAERLWGEVSRLGGQIVDREQGRVDFPATLSDREVMLCWQLGEETLGYWHDPGEGCDQRRPLEGTAPPTSRH